MAQASVGESLVALPPVLCRECIMTTRKIPLELVTTPATGVVSEAPKAIEIPEHLQNQLLFHREVAKRFRFAQLFCIGPGRP